MWLVGGHTRVVLLVHDRALVQHQQAIGKCRALPVGQRNRAALVILEPELIDLSRHFMQYRGALVSTPDLDRRSQFAHMVERPPAIGEFQDRGQPHDSLRRRWKPFHGSQDHRVCGLRRRKLRSLSEGDRGAEEKSGGGKSKRRLQLALHGFVFLLSRLG
jgi:hypothetical protein